MSDHKITTAQQKVNEANYARGYDLIWGPKELPEEEKPQTPADILKEMQEGE
jgi:hypothetical protein|tara:strand:+ start:721 stop:876 length:156 start_codon:yes stop_codon:yes gene_type:complete